jgi:DNA-binding CsgD family transcriptional regulator
MTRLLFVPDLNVLLWLDLSTLPEDLVEAVRRGEWKPPAPYAHLAGKLSAYWQEGLVIVTALPLQDGTTPGRPRVNRRQREIMRMLREGLTTRQMAMRLKVHPRTVYAHIAALKRVFGAATRAELADKGRALER